MLLLALSWQYCDLYCAAARVDRKAVQQCYPIWECAGALSLALQLKCTAVWTHIAVAYTWSILISLLPAGDHHLVDTRLGVRLLSASIP